MKYSLIPFTFLTLIACNNSNKENEKQSTIDSLKNEISKRDEASKNESADEEKHHREKEIANERNSVLKRVTTDQAAFTALTLGGFRDIRFNLFNDYKYKLEQIIIKVHYIKANGVEVKTETNVLKDIGPNSRMALTAPDYTVAGKDIRITIEAVLCKAINLCFYSNIDAAKSNDPYKCK